MHAITRNSFPLILVHFFKKFNNQLGEYLEEIKCVVIISESYSLCRIIANNGWKLEEIYYAYVSFTLPIPLPFTVLHFRIVIYSKLHSKSCDYLIQMVSQFLQFITCLAQLTDNQINVNLIGKSSRHKFLYSLTLWSWFVRWSMAMIQSNLQNIFMGLCPSWES